MDTSTDTGTDRNSSTGAIAAANTGAGAGARFTFGHRVLNQEGGYFATGNRDGKAYFALPMATGLALMELPVLRREFGIDETTEDGRMLTLVERALKFVPVIHANDAIPNELLDGSASWSVEERHRLLARVHVTLHLVAWMTGKPVKRGDLSQFVADLEKPEFKAEVKRSMAELTKHLGLEDGGKGGTAEIERRIDVLVHEFSFIEGLRDRLTAIHGIGAMMRMALKHNRRLSVREFAGRLPVLLDSAFHKLNREFAALDKQHKNIAELLGDMDKSVSLIRAVRDEIHCSLMIWDDLVDAWEKEREREKQTHMANEDALADLLTETHRFLVENYPIVHIW